MSKEFELLERWRSGDKRAGDELVTKYYRQIRRFFANSVSDDEFQDLTNETFRRLMTTGSKIEGSSTFRTFLYRIARNTLFDHLRKRYRDDARGFDPMTHTIEDVQAVTPSRAVAQLQQHQRLVACLRALPTETKLLLENYYWNGFKADELAEIHEISPVTVRTRIHAAKRRLAQCLGKDAPVAKVDLGGNDTARADEPIDAPDDRLAEALRALGVLLTSGPAKL